MLSDTSTKTLEGLPNFVVAFAVFIFVMIMATAPVFLSLRSLSFVYAQVLYDLGRKTFKFVSTLFPPKLDGCNRDKSCENNRGKDQGKSHDQFGKAKEKAVPSMFKSYHSLLVLMAITVVFCVSSSGEAVSAEAIPESFEEEVS